MSLILDVSHWTNFSSMKILYSSCFCCYLLLPIFLSFSWKVYFLHICLAKCYSFIKKQLKYHLFSVLISILFTPTFLCSKLVTDPMFSLCVTYLYHKIHNATLWFFKNVFQPLKFKFSNAQYSRVALHLSVQLCQT